MIQNRFRDNKQQKHFIGNQIRAQRVLCIDNNNANKGVISIRDALELANNDGLDLVQISESSCEPNVPTCKIMDYSKFKFEISKKEKLAKKKQRENSVKVKEVRFRPNTDDNDLKIKAKQTQEFLDDGCKVKITIVFKGRELSYKEAGHETMRKFLDLVTGQVCSSPSLSGKFLSAMIAPLSREDRKAAS